MEAEKSAGRLTLSDEEVRRRLAGRSENMLHLIGMPLLLLLAIAAADSSLPFYLFRFAAWRRPIRSLSHRQIDDDHSENLGGARKIMMSRIRSVRWGA